jgi:hypothetical protein
MAEDFDMQRKRIENNRKFIEKQLRGGEEVTKFLEKQDKELKDFKLPWYNTTFGEMFSGEQDRSRVEFIRGYHNLRRSQEKKIPKLIASVGEQNPDLSQDKITAIISGLAETIRLNTLSNAELKKTIDDNNKKTGENTSATNAVTGIGRQ